MVPIFLIWASKLSKLGPKTCQDRPKRAPRWSQDGQVGANMEPRWHQDGQRCAKIGPRGHQDGAKMAKLEPILSQDGPKIAPRGSQRGTKITENRSWKPSGHPKKNKKQKCNKPMRKPHLTSQKCNKHMRKLHVRK